VTLFEWVLVVGAPLTPFVLIFLARHWRDENAATLDEHRVVLPGHFVLGNMSGGGFGT